MYALLGSAGESSLPQTKQKSKRRSIQAAQFGDPGTVRMEEEEEELWHMFTEAIRAVAPHLLAGKRGKHAQTGEPYTKSDLVADVTLHLQGWAIEASRLSAFYHRKGHLSPVERQAVKAWSKGTASTLVGKATLATHLCVCCFSPRYLSLSASVCVPLSLCVSRPASVCVSLSLSASVCLSQPLCACL